MGTASRLPKRSSPRANLVPLQKCATGIGGFDELTQGGLPRGRPSLVCGGPGCGKTVLAMQFLVSGALEHGEPGVFVSFEEGIEDLKKNVASFGFDLGALVKKKLLLIEQVRVERSEIEETGEYDLEGLFIRLGYAIDSIGARRVVLDTIESLFSGFSNTAILRAELRRLFGWLKERNITAVITGERGEGTLTRQGLEEYVSDCVVLLDHRVGAGVATRRLRVVKYRGSIHGTNEYPFLIDEKGISVIPITSLGLQHEASEESVRSGVPRLDEMLGKGIYRGSTVLITGTAGSGKSSLAAHFADATARAGERCLYFAFEESPQQILRNMRSIGLDLEPWLRKGLLRIDAARPTLYGLEMHLAIMHKAIMDFEPSAVIVDPISNLRQGASDAELMPMLVRLIDFIKMRKITALFTSLTSGGMDLESTESGTSSLMDTWLLLRNLEVSGERNRTLYLLKSRGMSHSNQVREFVLTDRGVELLDVYAGPQGVLTGRARIVQEALDDAEDARRKARLEKQEEHHRRKRAQIAAQITALQAELDAESSELERARELELKHEQVRVALERKVTQADRDKPSPRRPRKQNGRKHESRKHNGRNEARS